MTHWKLVGLLHGRLFTATRLFITNNRLHLKFASDSFSTMALYKSIYFTLSVYNVQLRNTGRAKCIVCPTNPTVGRATALPAHYVPTPLVAGDWH